MSKCKYLIDISPYDPLCDHPCRLYGGGAVEAECETCQYRIEDLEAENAKLQDELEFANNQCERAILELLDQQEQLKVENDKLRELVRAMWGCISHIGEYDVFYYDMAEDGCGMSCTVNGEHCCADKLHDRMCELGVEVGE